jgi:NAD(P)-dependent dehydrogenase (short-subunit alcohol dehydrogenase family)
MLGKAFAIAVAAAVLSQWHAAWQFDLGELLRGKRVLVTGSSAGIGREIALLYCSHGAQVVLTSRSPAALESAAAACQALHPEARAYAIVSDLSTEAGCRELVEQGVQRLGGGLDVLVLNHVQGMYQRWQDVEGRLGLLRRLFAVNVFGYVYAAEFALPELRKAAGSLIVVSSLAGRMGLPKVAPYSASKHALHGFFNSLRHDLESAGAGVAITTAVLGNIDTAQARKATGAELDILHWHSPSGAAHAIVEAGAKRAREVLYPFAQLRFTTWLDALLPSAAHAMIRAAIPT